jgi:hypothetical protein
MYIYRKEIFLIKEDIPTLLVKAYIIIDLVYVARKDSSTRHIFKSCFVVSLFRILAALFRTPGDRANFSHSTGTFRDLSYDNVSKELAHWLKKAYIKKIVDTLYSKF